MRAPDNSVGGWVDATLLERRQLRGKFAWSPIRRRVPMTAGERGDDSMRHKPWYPYAPDQAFGQRGARDDTLVADLDAQRPPPPRAGDRAGPGRPHRGSRSGSPAAGPSDGASVINPTSRPPR